MQSKLAGLLSDVDTPFIEAVRNPEQRQRLLTDLSRRRALLAISSLVLVLLQILNSSSAPSSAVTLIGICGIFALMLHFDLSVKMIKLYASLVEDPERHPGDSSTH